MQGRSEGMPNATGRVAPPGPPPPPPPACIAPHYPANEMLRDLKEAREKRARTSGGGAGAAMPVPSRSGGGRVATLRDVVPSEDSDVCDVCEGRSVPGNELVRCGFGNCIQEPGESTARRACWHPACVQGLSARTRQVVCARHEKNLIGHPRRQEFRVVAIDSYQNGAFDSDINGAEVE